MADQQELKRTIEDGLRRVAESRGITGQTSKVRHLATWVLTDLLFPAYIEAGEWDGLVQRASDNADSLPAGWRLVEPERVPRQPGPPRVVKYVPPTPPPVPPRDCLCGCGEPVYFGFYPNGAHTTRHQHQTIRAVAAGTLTPAEGLDLMPSSRPRTRLATLLTKKGIDFDPELAVWVGPEYCVQGHELTSENTLQEGRCRVCKQLYNDARKSEYRAIVDAAKSVPCADCGQTFDPRAMDLDHLPGVEKVVNLARMVINHTEYTRDQIEAEIAKCEAVCVNCHRLRTEARWERRSGGSRYGWYLAQKAHPCTDCGVQYSASAMDFDHLPEYEKVAHVSQMVKGTTRLTLPDGTRRKYTLEEIAEEIAKCELVCANCHRLRSASRGSWAESHA